VNIRRAEVSDVEKFIEVYLRAYSGMEKYAYTRRRDVKNYFKWLLSRDSEGFMVAEVDGVVTGFVACDTNWFSIFERKKVGEIHELFVLPEYRGRGIGSKLLLLSVEYAAKKGRDVAELWVGKTNYRARRFYLSHGFEERGEWGKWIRMRKDLSYSQNDIFSRFVS